MTGLERRWMRVVLSSFAGSSAGFTVRDEEVDYVAAAERFMSEASEKACLGLRLAVLMVMTAPLWMWGRMKSLSGLAPDARSELLDELLRHRFFAVRELCLLLKLVACMGIFRSGAARARTGFDRPERRPLVVLREAAA